MIGLVDNKCDTSKLDIEGTASVQVLGGNHSREALQILRTRTKSESYTTENNFVYMDVYCNLTKEQAWYLGMSHNSIHTNSKAMNFIENIRFFHKARQDCTDKMPGETKKKIAEKWRSIISAVLNISVRSLKCHLTDMSSFHLF